MQSYPVHQVVFQGGDHRIMTVQRVNSPVDTTVSQSALGLQHQDSVEDQQPTHAMLTPVPVSINVCRVNIPVQKITNGTIFFWGTSNLHYSDNYCQSIC